MHAGRTARPLLGLVAICFAVSFLAAGPARAETSFEGDPLVVTQDENGDGKDDAANVAQNIRLKGSSLTISLEGYLFLPGAEPNTSWSPSAIVDTAVNTQTWTCSSSSGCARTFGFELYSRPGGPAGNYTIVLNVTTTDTIVGPSSVFTRVWLEPGSFVAPPAADASLLMVTGAASVAAAVAAAWWFQRRPERVEVKTGKGYFAETFQREQALRIVEPFIRRGYATLVISRVHPDEIRSMLPFEGVQPLWLVDYSDDAPKKVDAVPPSLEKLFSRASSFLEGALRTAVVVDGLEFLIDNSNFSSVMRLLRRLIDIVAQRDSLILATVAPNSLGPKERSNLERELTHVPL